MKMTVSRSQAEILESEIHEQLEFADGKVGGRLLAYGAGILLERLSRQIQEQPDADPVTLRGEKAAIEILEFILAPESEV